MSMFILKIKYKLLRLRKKLRRHKVKLIPEPRYDEVYYKALEIMHKEESDVLDSLKKEVGC